MNNGSKIIAGVDIGTAKVVVLVGDIVNGRSLNIIGMGQCSSRGVIKGEIIDFKAASDCTHAAIQAAESHAKTRIEGVYLAQSGGHIQGFYNEAGITVTAPDNLVSSTDIETVRGLAKAKELPDNRTVVHRIRRPFRLDGRTVSNPELLDGQRLEVGYWIAHADMAKVEDSIRIINGFSLKVHEIILSSLASGAIVLNDTERRNGALVIDIGSGVTDFILYRDGYVEMTGTLPVGGDHITNDLSLGLRISYSEAESLKIKHGRAIARPGDKGEKVWLIGDRSIGDRQIPPYSINRIVNARVEEIFQVVKTRIGASWQPEKAAAGVVITGGVSRLPEIDEVARKVFGVEARAGEAESWINEGLRNPEYSTALGLLYYGLNNQSKASNSGPKRKGIFPRIFA